MQRLGLILVALLMLAGCAAGSPGGSGSGGSDQGSDAAHNAASPAIEQNDGEPGDEGPGQIDEGDSGGSGGGSLTLPQLPIGGGTVEFTEAGPGCAFVSWTGTAPLPSGVAVAIEGFTAPDQFTVDPKPCEGQPPCLSGGVLKADGGPCTVTVNWSGVQPTAAEPWELAVTSATVTCANEEDCKQTESLAQEAGHQAIGLAIPTG